MSEATCWVVFTTLWLASWPLGRWAHIRNAANTAAMNRRIGWAYGYGAGVVDGKHGRYDPTPPEDGRSRSAAASGRTVDE